MGGVKDGGVRTIFWQSDSNKTVNVNWLLAYSELPVIYKLTCYPFNNLSVCKIEICCYPLYVIKVAGYGVPPTETKSNVIGHSVG